MTGVSFSQYVTAKSGEVWLGLYRVGDEYELKASTLVVVDADMDSKDIRVDQPTEPLFLVRGLEQLQPGKVTALIRKWEFLYPGQISYIRSNRFAYFTLRAVGVVVDKGPSQIEIQGYNLILSGSSSKQGSQTLVDWAEGLGATPGVMWAGDLDRDGEIDLFMNMGVDDLWVEFALFLSSAATEGEVVGKAATWRAAVE